MNHQALLALLADLYTQVTALTVENQQLHAQLADTSSSTTEQEK